MLIYIFQIWGGLFYLLNKVFFSKSERSLDKRKKQRLRIWAWIVYLLGLPAWISIFILERNWIAAAIESSGIPAVLTGLIIAVRGHGHENKWLDHLSKLMIVLGLAFSLHDFGGITTLNQILELGVASGFLIGTYMLAKEKSQGYFWFMLMNISCAWLMAIEHYPLLMTQQLISLGFVIDAYWVRHKYYVMIN